MRGFALALLCLALFGCNQRSDQSGPRNSPDTIGMQGSELAVEVAAVMAEVKRLEALAADDDSLHASMRRELRRGATEHENAVDACAIVPNPNECAILAFGRRAHDLRVASSATRSADDKGITQGPFAYRCEGLDALISAVFIKSDPGAVSLKWLDRSVVLRKGLDGSDAKYSGKSTDGDWNFQHQDERALLTPPGKPDMTCTQEVVG